MDVDEDGRIEEGIIGDKCGKRLSPNAPTSSPELIQAVKKSRENTEISEKVQIWKYTLSQKCTFKFQQVCWHLAMTCYKLISRMSCDSLLTTSLPPKLPELKLLQKW